MSTKSKWSDLLSGDRTRTAAAANSLLPAWVSLVIVVLIGWQLAKIFWTMMPGPAAGTAVVVPPGQTAFRSADSGAVDVHSIAAASIFGKANPDEVQAALVPTEDLDETNLSNLTLRGTIASDQPEFSIAIIADGGNEEKVYVVGDPVASGASLHAVYPDRVVLNERGELTNLSLPREFSNRTSTNVRRTTPIRQVTNTQSIQSVVAQNVSRLADVIRPTPYFVNGQQQGYRVYPGRDRQQFSALGLRPGDLIKEIDGQSLSDPTQAMQIFQSLGKASQVSVTVERDGTPETIVLKTDQLDLGKEQTK